MSFTVLLCHPATPSDAVRQISASISVEPDATLSIDYSLSGAVDQIRANAAVAAGEALWQHTCFELFVGATNDAEYYEFNFSPSGAWALYGFRDYRDGGPLHIEGLAPRIDVQRQSDELRLHAELALEYLPGVHRGVQLSLGISAVVEDVTGALSYWSIKHPPGKPDFHHADNFAMQIELPAVTEKERGCAATA